jgi:hypothetical protein
MEGVTKKEEDVQVQQGCLTAVDNINIPRAGLNLYEFVLFRNTIKLQTFYFDAPNMYVC